MSVVLEVISGEPGTPEYQAGKARQSVTDFFTGRAGDAADVAYRARAPGYRRLLVQPKT